MCGRTACTLAPPDICHACGYKAPDGKWRQPKWKDPPGGQKYYTSYNMAPGSHIPALMSKKHLSTAVDVKDPKEELPPFKDEDKEDPSVISKQQVETSVKDGEQKDSFTEDGENPIEWVVQPMRWGLVPSWHTGNPNSVSYSMINARIEGILDKVSFRRPLEKGRRCVILVDGYFEWHRTTDGGKQPYFIYFPHANPETVDLLNTDANDPERVYTGRRLLTLAGLFDIWTPKDGGAPLYSCSVITVNSHKCLSWMHDRMPAILDGEDEVRAWLDDEAVPLNKALQLIRPKATVHWHPVSTIVNNAKNNTEECLKPIDLKKQKEPKDASSTFMKSWLDKGKKRASEQNQEKESKDEDEHVHNKEDEDELIPSPEKKPKSEIENL